MLITVLLLPSCTDLAESDTAEKSGGDGTPDLGFDVDAAGVGSTLTLTWVDADSVTSSHPRFGDVLTSAPAESTTLIDVAEPDPSLLVEWTTSAPGALFGFFVPALHQDTDGDGVPSADESFVGVGLEWALYIKGDLPSEFEAFGFAEGWNGLDYLSLTPDDPMSIPLDAQLVGDDGIELGGTWASVPPTSARLAFTSVNAYVAAPAVYDEPAVSPWGATVSGPPPEDHLGYEYDDTTGALEAGIAYDDRDASGSLTTGDTPLFAICSGSDPVSLFHVPAPEDLATAFDDANSGVTPGWTALRIGPNSDSELGPAERSSLVVGPDCTN